MKIWYVLKWVYQALLAELHKLCDMILTGTFYLTAESERLWIGVNPETVSLDANNIQAAPLQVRFWAGEGSEKAAMSAYLTFRIESVVGSSVTKLFEDKPEAKVSSYDYTIPSDQYATANRISIYAYEDAARTKEIDSKQVNIIAANPTPFPRSGDWNVANVYKNGEYLKQDNVLYMWTSRVSGNTEISPKEWIEAHQESGLWTPYPYDKLIAAGIALFDFALIGSAVFQDEYMISQQGVDASGNPTNDFRKFGTEEFTPNLLLNFLIGKAIFNDAEIRGKFSTSLGGTRIEIDPKSNSIKLYNQYNNEVGDISFLEEDYQGSKIYYPRIRLSRYRDNRMINDAIIGDRNVQFTVNTGSVTYSCILDPIYGLTFYQGNAPMKNYPAS